MTFCAHTASLALLLPLAIAAQSDAEHAEQAVLEASFQSQMSGCRMIGHFTEFGSENPPQTDSYTIAKVKKLRDEKWQFDATIEYGGKSVTVPLAVDVYWAGDTPTIQVTDLAVPTLGKFNARVVVHDDHYAGMWSGKDHGGHMFGKIERAHPPTPKSQGKQGVATWASWRGPAGTGEAPDSNPPIEWSEDQNVGWKIPLPGLGNSTPIVWGDRIYLTSAVELETPDKESGDAPTTGSGDSQPESGRRGGRRRRGFGGHNNARPTKMFDFRVLAIDRKDGSVIWDKSVKKAVPHESGHNTGSQASSSPVTDGEHIYAHFGSRGIHCLDMDGKVKWSRDFGLMRTRAQFGEGSSPALSGNTLVINWDHEGDSYIYALNKKTGKELWSTPRKEITSWSTPVIAKVGRREQVIVSATNASRSYDLKSGKEIWRCTGMTTNVVPTPIVHDGVAYLMSGYRGTALQAIKLSGAKNDISDSKHVLWTHNRQTSYVPSALLYNNQLYFMRSNNAVLSCVDATSGKPNYEGQRLSGLRTVYSSPVGANGRIYIPSRGGSTKVLKAGATYEELATNELDDVFDASPVIIGEDLYLRGRQSLYCIRQDKK